MYIHDDDCFYYYCLRNNVIIAHENLSSFVALLHMVSCLRCLRWLSFLQMMKFENIHVDLVSLVWDPTLFLIYELGSQWFSSRSPIPHHCSLLLICVTFICMKCVLITLSQMYSRSFKLHNCDHSLIFMMCVFFMQASATKRDLTI